MKKITERPIEAIERRRAIYSLKIQQEEQALCLQVFGPGSPEGYKFVVGQTREERLSNWRNILAEIEAELRTFGHSSCSNRKHDPTSSQTSAIGYALLPKTDQDYRLICRSFDTE
jgi:hypothetical protein